MIGCGRKRLYVCSSYADLIVMFMMGSSLRLGFRLAFMAGVLDIFLSFSVFGSSSFSSLLLASVLVLVGAVLVTTLQHRIFGCILVLSFSIVWWLFYYIIYENPATISILGYINLGLGIFGSVLGLMKK